MTDSLKQRSLAYIRHKGDWVSGGELEAKALQAKFKASNVSRRLRELQNEGLIERRLFRTGRVKTVYYRAISNYDSTVEFLCKAFNGKLEGDKL